MIDRLFSRSNDGDFAIVIGIAGYRFLRALEGPLEDAKAFESWLVKFGRVPRRHIRLVLSRRTDAERPAQEQIDDAFMNIFKKALQRRNRSQAVRRLYVYFAGHGCAADVRHVALLMANARIEALNRALDSAQYHSHLVNRGLFPEQILFYDCCRNYDHRIRGQAPGWTPAEPNGIYAPHVSQFVLFAAGFTEFAYERPFRYGVRRGLFTRALLEGLQGAAAVLSQLTPGTYDITSDSLKVYVRNRLDELTEEENVRQHLAWNPAGSTEDVVLVRHATPQMWRVSVRAPFPTGEIVVSDKWGEDIGRENVDEGVARFDLPPGLYTFKVPPAWSVTAEVGPGKRPDVP
jgi:hypothetical protein